MRLNVNAVLAVVFAALMAVGTVLQPASVHGAEARYSAVWKENRLPGTTSWEITDPAPDHWLEGYASATSVGAGSALRFHVSTVDAHYRADIYRMGWYQGRGARLLRSIRKLKGHHHAVPTPNPATGLVACTWPVAFTVFIPRSWLSGVYLVKLTGSSGIEAWIPFVVRSITPAKFIFVHAVNTDEAYNEWGGTSLYGNSAYAGKPPVSIGGQRLTASLYHRAVEVSFDRPFSDDAGAGEFFLWEYHMVRWLERRGYNVSYLTDVDLETHPALLRGAKAILVVGHDEYWTAGMRNAVQTAVDTGVNLAVFGGNTMSWQARYALSLGVPDRVLVCFKAANSYAAPLVDPDAGTPRDTTYWRNAPVYAPESELLGANFGGLPAGRGTGLETFPWVVSDASNWVYAHTGLRNGDRIPQLIGDEYDNVLPYLPHPANLHILSASPLIADSGDGFDVQNATLYTADSGALVFDAGEIDWPFGLDAFSIDLGPGAGIRAARPDPIAHPIVAVQIMTQNILRRFSQRGNLHPPLLAISLRSKVAFRHRGTVSVGVTSALGKPVAAARVELDARSSGTASPLEGTTNGKGIAAFRISAQRTVSYPVVTVWAGGNSPAVTRFFVLGPLS